MIILITEILLLALGFSLLSLSMSRHYTQVINSRQRLSTKAVWLYRLLGYGILIAGLVLALMFWGVTLGLVYWFGTAMLVVLPLSLTLTYKPHWLLMIPLIFDMLFNPLAKKA